jgi:REP element-mobilizing transposase RayT
MEGRALFREEADRQAFLDRLAGLIPPTGVIVLAWALMPNHVHLLVRSGPTPLSTVMARLLTGYAGAFNRRHKRRGRLFQNRYKSILVEDEPYLLELVRYLHLNPLRAGLVGDLRALDRYPWTGHSALLGRVARPWQAIGEVLEQYGPTRHRARRAYRAFVAEGVAQGRRPDLEGGGFVRSAGGWAAVASLRRGREHGLSDERILGSGDFVETVYRQLIPRQPTIPNARAAAILPALIARCSSAWGVDAEEVRAGCRRHRVAQVRAVAGYLGTSCLGLSAIALAHAMGVTGSAIRAGVGRGPVILARSGLTIADLLPESTRRRANMG